MGPNDHVDLTTELIRSGGDLTAASEELEADLDVDRTIHVLERVHEPIGGRGIRAATGRRRPGAAREYCWSSGDARQ